MTWGATNRDMLLYRKSRLWGCYKLRYVTHVSKSETTLPTVSLEPYFISGKKWAIRSNMFSSSLVKLLSQPQWSSNSFWSRIWMFETPVTRFYAWLDFKNNISLNRHYVTILISMRIQFFGPIVLLCTLGSGKLWSF